MISCVYGLRPKLVAIISINNYTIYNTTTVVFPVLLLLYTTQRDILKIKCLMREGSKRPIARKRSVSKYEYVIVRVQGVQEFIKLVGNVGKYLPINTASYSRKLQSSSTSP